MDISYLGHSSFRLKGKQGTVVLDPFDASVGFPFPSTTADIVTVSHAHADHNNLKGVKPVADKEKVWTVEAAGEYEVGGITIFGYETFHDDKQGAERGKNIVFTVVIDGVRIVHLGDLGHDLSQAFLEDLGTVDILICPVGGVYTITAEIATNLISEIEPKYVIPMHYRTDKHSATYSELATVEDFMKAFGITVESVKTLTVTQSSLPEQTTLVVLQ